MERLVLMYVEKEKKEQSDIKKKNEQVLQCVTFVLDFFYFKKINLDTSSIHIDSVSVRMRYDS
jgi:hypothetical protein